jgi:hypothetical protein
MRAVLLAVGAGWTVGEILVAVVIIAACVGVVYVALQEFGVAIPPWVVRIFWICLCAVVAVLAIRFLLSL